MTLHELPADTLLAKLADAQEAYVELRGVADTAKNAADIVYSEAYLAIKSAEKISVEDAKHRAKVAEVYQEAWQYALLKAQERDKAMMALERVRTACDLWRTEQASRRKV